MIFIVSFFSKDSGEIYIIKKFEICESFWEKQTSKNVLLNKRIIELKATICLYAVYIIKIQAIQASILHKRVFYKDSMVQKDPDFF